jgi:hypothetical protein
VGTDGTGKGYYRDLYPRTGQGRGSVARRRHCGRAGGRFYQSRQVICGAGE